MSQRNHKLIFEFLCKKFLTHEPFTKDELRSVVSGVGSNTFNTYWSKWIKNFLVNMSEERFRVAEAFRPYSTWEKFYWICTQKRRTYRDYTEHTYNNVIIYDFLMPLSNEEHLRSTLDALFYKDAVLARLKSIGHGNLKKYLSIQDTDSPGEILEKAGQLVADHFSGYSIIHVNGRFRAAALSTLADAVKLQEKGRHYLIDETTAVVRFIFQCGEPKRQEVGKLQYDFFDLEVVRLSEDDADMQVYRSINWLFRALFVENILQVVAGEDEIWMVESGVQNRLHRWVVEQ